MSLIKLGFESQTQDKIKEAISDFLGLIEITEKLLKGRGMAENVRSLVETIDYWGSL